MGQEAGGKKSRRGAPKARTGCNTCRQRHVKCDETRPACIKCTKAGWTCDGYDRSSKSPTAPTSTQTFFPADAVVPIPKYRPKPKPYQAVAKSPNSSNSVKQTQQSSRKRNASTDPEVSEIIQSLFQAPPERNPMLDFNGTPQEFKFLDTFLNRTSVDLGIYMDSSFWKVTAQQIARFENPVKHALIAFASMHSVSVQNMLEGTTDEATHTFSLTQYSKAVTDLKSRLSDDRFSYQVALTSCVLFLCFELFRGDPQSALNHIRNGQMLLTSYRTRFPSLSTVKVQTSPTDDYYDNVDWKIKEAFSRFRMSVMITCPILSEQYIPMGQLQDEDPSAAVFSNVSEAKVRLDALVARTFRPHETGPTSRFGTVSEEELQRRKELIERLKGWATQMGSLLLDAMPKPSPAEQRIILLLRTQNLLATIYNGVAPSNSQMTYDLYAPEFASIVTLAEHIVGEEETERLNAFHTTGYFTPAPEPEPYAFASTPAPLHVDPNAKEDELYAFKSSLTFPLMVTACKCRQPLLRRRAASLLERSTNPTGASVSIFSQVAAWVVDFEESHCKAPITEDSTTWPTEEQRVHGCYFLPFYDRVQSMQSIMFLWQPGGKGTEMKHWLEKFAFGGRTTWEGAPNLPLAPLKQ